MEKVLRLYKIPEVGDIVTVIGVGISLPQTGFSAGDLFIDSLNETLYEAQSSGGTISWVQVSFDSTKYYRDGSKEVPVFYTYSVQDGLEEYDVSFPANADRRAEITSFTYSATRMGNAPTISGTLMYRECLDEIWDDRCCVYFNKKFYFIDKIPTSEYNNTDERYKHSCEFVSENRLLENVYFTNVVDIEHYEGDITRLPMQWLDFTFFGGIDEFVSRLNLSLAYSGLDAQHVGFKVVKDTLPTVEEKLISISDTTLKAALDLIYETWEIPYWFDGYTIHIGYSNEQQMQQAGITMPTFQYGAVQSLLSLQKSQSNDIVNRITGFGSSENIPVFYPNKNPNAIEIQYERNQTLMVNYARIANPYKTVSLEPSQPEHQGTPSGSFFKFMPITKTYNYDQFMTVNVHHQPNVTEVDGMPSLYLSAIEDYNCQSRYFEQEYGGTAAVIGHSSAHPQYNIVCKRIWVWLHEGTHTLISFKDEMDAPSMFNTGGANSIIFEETHTPRFFVKAQSYTYTREQYEYMINATQGFTPYASANLIDKYFNLRTTANGVQYVWDNGTVTDTYDEVFPIDLTSLPNNTTCLSFTVGIMSNYNAPYADPAYVMTQLKTETKLVIKHTLLSDPDWSLNADGHVAHLWLYGIRLNANVTPQENDLIYFTREAGALPYFGQLLPYSFRDTDDIWLNAKNNEYLKENGTDYYTFDNLYKISCAKEHVENFDDIKPTIEGMVNNETPAKRIDQILDVAFDQDDNNDLQENGTDYQHPYFFVKLAKTSLDNGFGFNLFDCAVDGQTMQFNMADGNCGGCTFDVIVDYKDGGMPVNPVGVFEQATTINGVTYAAGTPKRDLTTGRVLVTRYEEVQQDTSAAEVWIALKKDNHTFGNYDNGAEVVLPDSVRGNNFVPHASDSFTIINICLPYAYVVAAEIRLYHALLDYMEKNNPRAWSFSIKFSSIYYKKHYEFMDRWLYEASQIPFIYNGITRKYYVQSYSYKMSNSSALPEVTVELNEKAKKKNVYYPVPYNPSTEPSATYYTQQQQKALKKIVSDYMSGFSPSDIEAENLHVNGDVTLANGTSLNAQIAALNSQILSNEKVLTAENLWSKVKSGADNTNSFVDGIFATDLNTTTDTDVRITHNQGGAVGDNSLRAVFAGNSSSFTFNQKIAVAENTKHTVAFFAKCATQDDVVVDVTWYDEYDNELDNTKVSVNVGDEWGQYVVPFSTEDDAAYALLAFSYFGEDSDVAVDLDGIAVYPTDYTAQDQDGSSVANSLLPTNYKMSTADIFNAIYKLGGGGSSSDILVCTFENNTIDKTPQEIYEARQNGKVVLCYNGSSIYYLTVAQHSNSDYIIIFEKIDNPNLNFPKITYIWYLNSSWSFHTTYLQRRLIGSGTGQNIKTMNGKSLPGSGNIETEDWQTIVADDGDTGTTITPTTDYTVIFIDNSANSSDYTVAFDTTGVDTVFEEYDSLAVRATDIARFDIKKFVSSNDVYLSVKRTDIATRNIISFIADDDIQKAMAKDGTTLEQYLQGVDYYQGNYKPNKFVNSNSSVTINGVDYDIYNIYYWDGSNGYVPIGVQTGGFIINVVALVPHNFVFSPQKTVLNAGLSGSQIPVIWCRSDNFAFYKGTGVTGNEEISYLVSYSQI